MTNWFIQYVSLRLRQHCPGVRSQPRARLLKALVLATWWSALVAVPAAGMAAGSTILVLGDSISAAYGIQREQGWVQQLADRVGDLETPWRVVNASLSGETTGGGLARLPGALTDHRPEVVIIELGGNDGLRGYPVDRIRDNLTDMVRLAQEAGSRVLLVGIEIPPNYGPRYTRAFAAVFREVAQARSVPLVPFILEQVALQPELMQDDGIHPTADAQPLLLDTVWPYLADVLGADAATADHRASR